MLPEPGAAPEADDARADAEHPAGRAPLGLSESSDDGSVQPKPPPGQARRTSEVPTDSAPFDVAAAHKKSGQTTRRGSLKNGALGIPTGGLKMPGADTDVATSSRSAPNGPRAAIHTCASS